MPIWSVPYESVIHTKPVLAGICTTGDAETCGAHVPYSRSDRCCPNEHEWELWAHKRYGNGTTRGLRKRIVWPCFFCDQYYFTREGLLDHIHFDSSW